MTTTATDVRENEKDQIDNIERNHVELTDLGNSTLHNKVLNEEARQATATEHSLTLWQALKTYRKAAFWSILYDILQ